MLPKVTAFLTNQGPMIARYPKRIMLIPNVISRTFFHLLETGLGEIKMIRKAIASQVNPSALARCMSPARIPSNKGESKEVFGDER